MRMQGFTVHHGRNPSMFNVSLWHILSQSSQNTPADLVLTGNEKLGNISLPILITTPQLTVPNPSNPLVQQHYKKKKNQTVVLILSSERFRWHCPLLALQTPLLLLFQLSGRPWRFLSRETQSTPSSFRQGTALSAEHPPARLQLQSQLALQSTQTFQSASQPNSTSKSNALQVLEECHCVI